MVEGVTEGILEGKPGEEEFGHREISLGERRSKWKSLILFVPFDFPSALTPVL